MKTTSGQAAAAAGAGNLGPTRGTRTTYGLGRTQPPTTIISAKFVTRESIWSWSEIRPPAATASAALPAALARLILKPARPQCNK